MIVLNKSEILERIDLSLATALIEEAFVAYSKGETIVPPVGHMYFEDPPGDLHIKYGYKRGDDFFVVKVATGFYENPKIGIPSSQGLSLVYCSKTGTPRYLLADEGYLTNLRTALAGKIVAQYMAPKSVRSIGIIGSGIQARLQLLHLRDVVDCKKVLIWSRNITMAKKLAEDQSLEYFDIDVVDTAKEAAESSQLIVTTTPSKIPIILDEFIQPGTHVTAVGADGGGKQEIEAKLFRRLKTCVVDSFSQCSEYGDTSYALAEGNINPDSVVELGSVIENPGLGRQSDAEITLADLTGVAIQDIAIATAVVSFKEARASLIPPQIKPAGASHLP